MCTVGFTVGWEETCKLPRFVLSTMKQFGLAQESEKRRSRKTFLSLVVRGCPVKGRVE